LTQLLRFLADNLPTPFEAIVLGLPSLALAAGYLYAAGALKRDRGWATGYTRKLFHILVFVTAAAAQVVLGVGALFVFGAATSAVIFYALARGDGHVLYEAMARESDEPRRAHFIVVAYLATLGGGLLSNALFGEAAVFGYLVAGLGDAAGEPAGTRFGRHRYRVPSMPGVTAFRTWEGSAAVFAASLAAIAAARMITGGGLSVSPLLAIALASTVVESLSPHGWDNLTMQLVPSGLALWLW
jgi:phytol kinase